MDSPRVCFKASVLGRVNRYSVISENKSRYVKANRFSFKKLDLKILLGAKEGKRVFLVSSYIPTYNLRVFEKFVKSYFFYIDKKSENH